MPNRLSDITDIKAMFADEILCLDSKGTDEELIVPQLDDPETTEEPLVPLKTLQGIRDQLLDYDLYDMSGQEVATFDMAILEMLPGTTIDEYGSLYDLCSTIPEGWASNRPAFTRLLDLVETCEDRKELLAGILGDFLSSTWHWREALRRVAKLFPKTETVK